MEPELVHHCLIDTLWCTKLVIVKSEPKELPLCDESELSSEVGNPCWVKLQNNFEESGSVALSLKEALLTECHGGDEDVWRLYNLFEIVHRLHR